MSRVKEQFEQWQQEQEEAQAAFNEYPTYTDDERQAIAALILMQNGLIQQ